MQEREETSAQAPLISTEAEERIRTLYAEGRLGEAQRLVLEEIEKSLGRRGETTLPVRGEMLAGRCKNALETAFDEIYDRVFLKERGDWSDEEPAGLLSGMEGKRCTCYEGSVGCLGPPCVEEPPEILGIPVVLDETMSQDLVKIGDLTFRIGNSEDAP